MNNGTESGNKIETDMGTLILPEPKNDGAAWIGKSITRILPALPTRVDHKQFAASVMIAANELNGNECDPKSVLMAAFNAARIGLMPGKALGLCYFVPFKGVCTLIPGYRGYIDLAISNRYITHVDSEVVLRGEDFRHWTDEAGEHITHEMPIDRDVKADNVIGTYCVYHVRAGGSGICVMNRKQIDHVKKDTPIWKQHFDEMCQKTVIRRAAKRWKITPDMAAAIHLDEQADREEAQTALIPADLSNGNGAPKAPSSLDDYDDLTGESANGYDGNERE